jgi:hypothetical protein
MTLSAIPKAYPQRIDALELARNNQVPDSRLANQMGNALNFINAYCRKQVLAANQANYTGTAGASGDNIWRGYFHSGHAARALRFIYILAPGSGSALSPVKDPYVTLSVKKVGSAAVTVNDHWGASLAATDRSPNKVMLHEQIFAIDADSDYELLVSATAGGTPVSIVAFEIGHDQLDNTVNYMLAPSYGYSEIYDANRQRLSQGSSEIWKRNASHLVAATRGQSTAVNFTGGTWTNFIDGTTAVAATSSGYMLGNGLLTPYMRQTQTAPKYGMAVYGSVSGGAGTGEARFQTDGGATLATVTGINGTPGWFTATGTMGATPTAFGKCDPQCRMSGAGTVSIEAISLYLLD